jgi:probable F420-dependent oxidoreductase
MNVNTQALATVSPNAPTIRAAITPSFGNGPGTVARNLELISWAESIGYDDVWLADRGGVDALTLAGILMRHVPRIRVGVAVVPAYTRTPAVFAATVATLADSSPGRFALGLGTSSQTIIEGWHGLALDKPLTRIRETVTLLRQMLAGQKTAFTGETVRSNGYRQPALSGPVPILLAALGPRMVNVAAALADGIVLNLFPLSALGRLVARVHNALALRERSSGEFEVGGRFQVMVTDDVAAARDEFRYQFAPYFANPVYNRFLGSTGYAREAAAIREAAVAKEWARARAALHDELVDSIAVIGDRQHCLDRMRRYTDAGIGTPMLYCLSDDPDVQRHTFAAFAPAEFRSCHD